MKFSRLNLAEKPFHPRTIRAILALCAVTAALSVHQQIEQITELNELTAKLTQQHSAALPSRPIKRQATGPEITQQDWLHLFEAMEQSITPAITLTSIKPDVPKKQISVTGMASEHESIANYVEQLQATGVIKNIRIQNLRKTEKSAAPYSFHLVMEWGAAL